MEWNRRRSNRNPSASVVSKLRLTASLAMMTAGSENSAIFCAAFSDSSTRSAAGTTRETRPERSASAASIMRPVSTMSIAFDLPTKRVRRCEPPMPGMTPSVISG